jgi:hypothetical protein
MPTVTGLYKVRQRMGLVRPFECADLAGADLVPKGPAMFHVKPRRSNEVRGKMHTP